MLLCTQKYDDSAPARLRQKEVDELKEQMKLASQNREKDLNMLRVSEVFDGSGPETEPSLEMSAFGFSCFGCFETNGRKPEAFSLMEIIRFYGIMVWMVRKLSLLRL